MSGPDMAMVITAFFAGVTGVIASLVAAYNSIRANKQSGATHDIVKEANANANSKG